MKETFLDKGGVKEILGAVTRKYDPKTDSVNSADENIYVDNTDPQNPLIGLNNDFVVKVDQLWDAVFNNGGKPPVEPEDPIAIEDVNITITAPVKGVAPDTNPIIANGLHFTIDSNGTSWWPAHSPFYPNTKYQFQFTLVADEGYTFTGINAIAVKVNGTKVTSVLSNSGDTLTAYYEFAQTESDSTGEEEEGWELTYNFPKTNTSPTSTTGRVNWNALTGYDGQTFDDEEIYTDAEEYNDSTEFYLQLYYKFATDSNWKLAPFDQWPLNPSASNDLRGWGLANTYMYIIGSNSTGGDIELKIIYDPSKKKS